MSRYIYDCRRLSFPFHPPSDVSRGAAVGPFVEPLVLAFLPDDEPGTVPERIGA